MLRDLRLHQTIANHGCTEGGVLDDAEYQDALTKPYMRPTSYSAGDACKYIFFTLLKLNARSLGLAV